MAMKHRIIALTLASFFVGMGIYRKQTPLLPASSLQIPSPRPHADSRIPAGDRESMPQTQPDFRGDPERRKSRNAPQEESIHRLQSESKRAWRIRTDSDGEYVRTLSGGIIELQGKGLRERGRWFLSKYAEALFGVKAEDLRLQSQDEGDLERLVFSQYRQGIPVAGAQISLLFQDQNLTRVQSDLSPWLPSASFPSSPDITLLRRSTTRLADRLLELTSIAIPQARHLSDPSKVFFPGQRVLVPAYQMDVSEDGENSPTLVTLWVDANTHRLLRWKKALIRN